jgi:glycosyltransferase involved in cell wall biosynthesis
MMSNKLGLKDEQVAVVHNGVDFAPDEKTETSPSPPVIGYLARICPEKGLDILIDAFALLKGRPIAQGLRLTIAGTVTPDDRIFLGQIKQRLDNLGLSNQVTIQPNISPEEKRIFFRKMTVFSVPNRQPEAFGLYLLEAMAAGVPVIAPRLGAAEEILQATRGGILFEPENTEGLAACLSHMLSHKEEARSMGQAGATAVREHFQGSNMAASFTGAVSPLLHP